MKKLDKLLLQSFIGPFILTFFVVVFILLTQYMLKYFDEFVGKDLGFYVFAELIMYFSINMTPVALPLAVLLSSLMTFGNLGEHFELTAIKSSGISLIRILLPLFVFVCLLSVLAFFSNNYIVPKANLSAYSLLYDIKQTKPSLDLKEGAFYNGIPNYSIKVNQKYPDGITLGDLIIYDHTSGQGNTKVILADSGKMYTINNDNYLMLELFNGNSYSELQSKGSRIGRNEIEDFHRNSFDESKIVFSLASFGLKETKKELFASNRLMKNAAQLRYDIDSMQQNIKGLKYEIYSNLTRYFSYHLKEGIEAPKEIIPDNLLKKVGPKEPKEEKPAGKKAVESESKNIASNSKERALPDKKISIERAQPDTKASEPSQKIKSKKGTRLSLEKKVTEKAKTNKTLKKEVKSDSALTVGTKLGQEEIKEDSVSLIKKEINQDSIRWAKFDSVFQMPHRKQKVTTQALSQARYVKNNVSMQATRVQNLEREINTYIIEKNKKFSQAVACLIMFLIGAPLGAIIKKGGLGIPVIISICFFIVFYVLSITGEKWGKEGLIDPVLATWVANIFLLPFGLVFLKQARNDVRVFESDFYKVLLDQFKTRLKKMKILK